MYIGKRIRELRKMQNMTLSQLAQKSGVQIATLSRIEHHKMTGTLESHIQVARALGVDITQLYKDITGDEKRIQIKKPHAASDVFVHSDKSSYEILTSNIMHKRMMPILLKIEPKGKTNAEQNQPGAEKFIFVLDGKIEVRIKNAVSKTTEAYTVAKNASLYFDASMEHVIANIGSKTAKAVCVVSPVAL